MRRVKRASGRDQAEPRLLTSQGRSQEKSGRWSSELQRVEREREETGARLLLKEWKRDCRQRRQGAQEMSGAIAVSKKQDAGGGRGRTPEGAEAQGRQQISRGGRQLGLNPEEGFREGDAREGEQAAG